ncbi:MAG: carbamoyl phosphate synthase small subunit [Saccharofermentans sp.]|nr:carbamoyl phosphate synthase small subunit [Saccharofermentans sp.]
MEKYLVLENGKVFKGEGFGSDKDVIAEAVFTTSMTGYLETLTDPSYKGQAVVQTFPLIGNYGVITPDAESAAIGVSAYIVRELCEYPSNFRCEMGLEDYLAKNDIPGIKGIDTRALTRILRESGTMNLMITSDLDKVDLDKIKNYVIKDPVKQVTADSVKVYSPVEEMKYNVAMIDCGTKLNIIRCLQERGCKVTLFPSDVKASEITAIDPDGLFLSNGPGDPTDNIDTINTLKELIPSKIPTMGICLGHQLLALAHGFTTEKLHYGHRGANHPVINKDTGKILITSQNHGYAVVDSSIDSNIAYPLFVNVNDNTNEGIKYTQEPAFSVQFHPEACGGPRDSEFLFDEFIKLMEREGK